MHTIKTKSDKKHDNSLFTKNNNHCIIKAEKGETTNVVCQYSM